MLARGLEGSSRPRRGASTGEGSRCMGGGASVCLSMGDVGREAWVSPGCARGGHWRAFRGNMLARGARSAARAERASAREGTRCMGRGVRVPFDGQRRAGGMGEPRGEPRRWPLARFQRQHARSRVGETRRDGAECAGGHSLHRGRRVRMGAWDGVGVQRVRGTG